MSLDLQPATPQARGSGRGQGRGHPGATTPPAVNAPALAAAMDPDFFAGHSLRAGHVTQAKRNDATDLEVISQTHHRSAKSISATCARPTCFATPRPAGWGL